MGLIAQDYYKWAVTLAAINDVDGIATGITAFDTTVLPAAMDGVAITDGVLRLPRRITFSTSEDADSWNIADPIVVTGMLDGVEITEDVMLTEAGGGEWVSTVIAADQLVSIALPDQPGSGTLTIGVGDVVFDGFRVCRAIKPLGTGNLLLKYAGFSEVLGVTQNILERLSPREILADPAATTPTDVGVTLYF